jgi:hypothetical protein
MKLTLSNINTHTIPLLHSDDLRNALTRTTDRRKRVAIQAELDRREAAGFDRPLGIEDYIYNPTNAQDECRHVNCSDTRNCI